MIKKGYIMIGFLDCIVEKLIQWSSREIENHKDEIEKSRSNYAKILELYEKYDEDTVPCKCSGPYNKDAEYVLHYLHEIFRDAVVYDLVEGETKKKRGKVSETYDTMDIIYKCEICGKEFPWCKTIEKRKQNSGGDRWRLLRKAFEHTKNHIEWEEE